MWLVSNIRAIEAHIELLCIISLGCDLELTPRLRCDWQLKLTALYPRGGSYPIVSNVVRLLVHPFEFGSQEIVDVFSNVTRTWGPIFFFFFEYRFCCLLRTLHDYDLRWGLATRVYKICWTELYQKSPKTCQRCKSANGLIRYVGFLSHQVQTLYGCCVHNWDLHKVLIIKDL